MAEYSKKAAVKPKPLSVLRSLEEKYVAVMKKLQFGRLRSVNVCVLESRQWKMCDLLNRILYYFQS